MQSFYHYGTSTLVAFDDEAWAGWEAYCQVLTVVLDILLIEMPNWVWTFAKFPCYCCFPKSGGKARLFIHRFSYQNHRRQSFAVIIRLSILRMLHQVAFLNRFRAFGGRAWLIGWTT